jgi:leucyl-tRNA synthetase
MTQDQTTPAEPTYDPAALQAKWRPVWEKLDPFRAGSAAEGAPKKYALTMFPYPSGDLHMGHAEVMALHDVLARFWWLKGYDVLNPIGWDSFGLPAENAAIKRDQHPSVYTYDNIETQAESFKRYAVSFDWSRRLHTSDPSTTTGPSGSSSSSASGAWRTARTRRSTGARRTRRCWRTSRSSTACASAAAPWSPSVS